jgi:replication factor C small subunit
MSNSDVINDVLWTEKYRPTRLEDMAMEDENRAVLQSTSKGGVIPHLLFVGPAGSGKTTISRILVKSLDCSVLSLERKLGARH